MQRKDLEKDIGIEVNFKLIFISYILVAKNCQKSFKISIIIAASEFSIKPLSKVVTSISIILQIF